MALAALSVRENSNKIWFSPHLIVSLQQNYKPTNNEKEKRLREALDEGV
jgi:hypothetical protein